MLMSNDLVASFNILFKVCRKYAYFFGDKIFTLKI